MPGWPLLWCKTAASVEIAGVSGGHPGCPKSCGRLQPKGIQYDRQTLEEGCNPLRHHAPPPPPLLTSLSAPVAACQTLSTTQDEYKEVGFDRVFPHYATHGDVFDEVLALLDNTVRPSGPAALCFIAYGPSGAGKTHLLFGPNLRLEKCAGLVFRAAFALFSAIDAEPDIEVCACLRGCAI